MHDIPINSTPGGEPAFMALLRVARAYEPTRKSNYWNRVQGIWSRVLVFQQGEGSGWVNCVGGGRSIPSPFPPTTDDGPRLITYDARMLFLTHTGMISTMCQTSPLTTPRLGIGVQLRASVSESARKRKRTSRLAWSTVPGRDVPSGRHSNVREALKSPACTSVQ